MYSPSRIARAVVKRAIRLSMIGTERGDRLSRFQMYQHLSKFKMTPGMTLSISDSGALCKCVGINEGWITRADWPEHDICNLKWPDNKFDFAISDQVLEHVKGDPFQAVEESRRVLKPNGIAIHTTVLIQPVHNHGGIISDMWRFTPEGLSYLCRNFSEVIEVGGWGHAFVPLIDWLGMKYDPVPLSKYTLLNKWATYNDPRYPMVTWIIARK